VFRIEAVWGAPRAPAAWGMESGGKEEQRRRVSPHPLLSTSPGHRAREGYGHSREQVNHPGRAGNSPS